jgi:hypothetical protein
MITLREPYSTKESAAGALIADGDFKLAVLVFDIPNCVCCFLFYVPNCIATIELLLRRTLVRLKFY